MRVCVLEGLYGNEGLLPARWQLRYSGKPLLDQMLSTPTLLWLGPKLGLDTHTAVELLCLVGAALSLAATLLDSLRDSLVYFCLWVLYLSLYQVSYSSPSIYQLCMSGRICNLQHSVLGWPGLSLLPVVSVLGPSVMEGVSDVPSVCLINKRVPSGVCLTECDYCEQSVYICHVMTTSKQLRSTTAKQASHTINTNDYFLGHLISQYFNISLLALMVSRDNLLLEIGFLCVLVAPLTLVRGSRGVREHDPVTFWLVRWLLFRLMFASGVVKLISRCPTWWGLTGVCVCARSKTLNSWYVLWLDSSVICVFSPDLPL